MNIKKHENDEEILFLLLILFISELRINAQSTVAGNSIYRFTVNGNVGFTGSTCGDNITGGLQWIAVQMQNNTFNTVVQGSESYPGSGNGLQNTNFSGTIEFTKANAITSVFYRTTLRFL